MQAGADALSLLANTARIQQVLDQWEQRRGGAIPPQLIDHIAPTRTEGINLRGLFRFSVERYADKILPSAAGRENDGGDRVRTKNKWNVAIYQGSAHCKESDTCLPATRDALEIYLSATVCHCTENERTPIRITDRELRWRTQKLLTHV